MCVLVNNSLCRKLSSILGSLDEILDTWWNFQSDSSTIFYSRFKLSCELDNFTSKLLYCACCLLKSIAINL